MKETKKSSVKVKDEGEIKIKSAAQEFPFIIVLTALLSASSSWILHVQRTAEKFEEMTKKSSQRHLKRKLWLVEKVEKREVVESDTKFVSEVPSEKELGKMEIKQG
jgi:hypothetical protein